jgi:hypothetical protein
LADVPESIHVDAGEENNPIISVSQNPAVVAAETDVNQGQ